MANELLALRSRTIQNILGERSRIGDGTTAIKMPEEDPRAEKLHQQLGVDEVMLSTPSVIDTTPQAAGDPQGRWFVKTSDNPQLDTLAYSMTGQTDVASAYGVRIRGGWPISSY